MSDQPRRRQLHFDSIEDIVADIDMLAAGDVETTGHFSFGQIMEHLARTFDVVSGHTPSPPIPLFMQWFGRMARPLILTRPMRPGFKLPAKAQSAFWPSEEIAVADAFAHLKESINRFTMTEPLPKHPLFGTMNRKQSDQLQCRHCELHLSFVHPTDHAS